MKMLHHAVDENKDGKLSEIEIEKAIQILQSAKTKAKALNGKLQDQNNSDNNNDKNDDNKFTIPIFNSEAFKNISAKSLIGKTTVEGFSYQSNKQF